jgi:hypothetical protein
MYSFEPIDLGTYRGDNYFLKGFVEPDPSEYDDFNPDVDATGYGVTLARKVPLGKNIEIVRMDTAHNQPHLDKEYLPPEVDEEKKIWLEDDYAYSRMKKYLLTNYEYHIDQYIYYNE